MNDDLIGDGPLVPLEEGRREPLLLGWTKPTLESYVPKQWEQPFIQEDLLLMNDGDCATLAIGGDWPEKPLRMARGRALPAPPAALQLGFSASEQYDPYADET